MATVSEAVGDDYRVVSCHWQDRRTAVLVCERGVSGPGLAHATAVWHCHRHRALIRPAVSINSYDQELPAEVGGGEGAAGRGGDAPMVRKVRLLILQPSAVKVHSSWYCPLTS